jgi:hypothetical protein
MEPEGSLPCSQEPSLFPIPEPDQSTPYNSILSKIRFNIILSRTSCRPSELFPSGLELLYHYAKFGPNMRNGVEMYK